MAKNKEGQTFLDKIWAFLGSVKLTVVVLLTLAATSIIGTLIPQNESAEWYFHKYGEGLFRVFSVFQIFDMYHSWWYQLLIVTLAVNIIVCSVDRFSATWKIVFTATPKCNPQQFRKRRDAVRYEPADASAGLAGRYQKWIKGHFSYHRLEETEKGTTIFAEKGRWTRFGVYVVHAGVVFLLVGALIGMFAGFDGFINIPEGGVVDAVRFRNTAEMQPLNFKIRCDDFNVSFYDNGAPKEYRSRLSIIEKGVVVRQKDIVVNDPLRYKGINMFQSSYGKLPPNGATVSFTDIRTGKSFSVDARMKAPVKLPDGQGIFVLQDYRDSYAYKGHHFQDTFIGTWTNGKGDVFEVVMPYPFPEFDVKSPEQLNRVSAFQISEKKATASIPENITLTFTSNDSGMQYKRTAAIGDPIVLPEGLGIFVITKIDNSYNFRGHPVGQAVIGTLTHKSGETEEIALPVRFSGFDKMRKGAMVITVADFSGNASPAEKIITVTAFKEKYYTGLQVTKDPGVWVVYFGFISIIIGCYITFFTSHKRVFVEIDRSRTKPVVLVAGTANKNQLGMQKYIETLSRKLQKLG